MFERRGDGEVDGSARAVETFSSPPLSAMKRSRNSAIARSTSGDGGCRA